jgi:hypothetical protein
MRGVGEQLIHWQLSYPHLFRMNVGKPCQCRLYVDEGREGSIKSLFNSLFISLSLPSPPSSAGRGNRVCDCEVVGSVGGRIELRVGRVCAVVVVVSVTEVRECARGGG